MYIYKLCMSMLNVQIYIKKIIIKINVLFFLYVYIYI